MTANTLFKDISVPVLAVGTNGEIKVEGYKGKSDAQACGEFIGGIIKAAK